TWPPWPIGGALLNHDLDVVIAALQRPHLLCSSLGIRATAVLLPGRLGYGSGQGRPRCGHLTGGALLPALILAAGVDHHRPLLRTVEGDGPLSDFVRGGGTMLCRLGLRHYPDLFPLILGHGVRNDALAFLIGGR